MSIPKPTNKNEVNTITNKMKMKSGSVDNINIKTS